MRMVGRLQNRCGKGKSYTREGNKKWFDRTYAFVKHWGRERMIRSSHLLLSVAVSWYLSVHALAIAESSRELRKRGRQGGLELAFGRAFILVTCLESSRCEMYCFLANKLDRCYFNPSKEIRGTQPFLKVSL